MAKSVDIPQDIIDNIIAAAGDDKRLLKQCTLVSSSFLLPSRKQLFSRISLPSEQTCQGIYQFLVQNPVIQSFVRTITITEDKYLMDSSGGPETSEWVNHGTSESLLAILRLPFCCLGHFSFIVRRDDWIWSPWDWNNFRSALKDALSNILVHSSILKTLSLTGITNMPISFFLHIVHLTTLELDSLSPYDFGDENSSLLTWAASNRMVPMASHAVIDRCVWRFGEEHMQSHKITEPIFLPFMCRLRFLEIYIDLGSANLHDFNILSSLMCPLCISLTSPATLEHLEFNLRFRDHGVIDDFESFRDTWNHLDFITAHPTGLRLQRVDINISYTFCHDVGEESDDHEVLNAVLDSLPSLRTKGILFVKANTLGLDSRILPVLQTMDMERIASGSQ